MSQQEESLKELTHARNVFRVHIALRAIESAFAVLIGAQALSTLISIPDRLWLWGLSIVLLLLSVLLVINAVEGIKDNLSRHRAAKGLIRIWHMEHTQSR